MKLSALVVVLAAADVCQAQDYLRKWNVYGAAGYGWTSDDEGSVGNGFAGGGGVGYRFNRRLEAVFDINAFRHRREGALGRAEFAGNGQYYTGNLLYHFSGSRFQPYILGGAGGIAYQVDRGINLPRETSTGGFAITFGAGAKAFVSERFSIRPEVRVYAGGRGAAGGIEPPIVNVRFAVGFGYHW